MSIPNDSNDSIEVTAATVDEAISQALEHLGAREDDVAIAVLNTPRAQSQHSRGRSSGFSAGGTFAVAARGGAIGGGAMLARGGGAGGLAGA
ncbi:MAG: Jag N-terminal domain-containing protein, partial [Candidatus Binataceae bacterium]